MVVTLVGDLSRVRPHLHPKTPERSSSTLSADAYQLRAHHAWCALLDWLPHRSNSVLHRTREPCTVTVTAAASKKRNASARTKRDAGRVNLSADASIIHSRYVCTPHGGCCSAVGPALDHQPVHAVLEVVWSSAAGSWDYIRGCQCLQGPKTNCWNLTRDLRKGRELDGSD